MTRHVVNQSMTGTSMSAQTTIPYGTQTMYRVESGLASVFGQGRPTSCTRK